MKKFEITREPVCGVSVRTLGKKNHRSPVRHFQRNFLKIFHKKKEIKEFLKKSGFSKRFSAEISENIQSKVFESWKSPLGSFSDSFSDFSGKWFVTCFSNSKNTACSLVILLATSLEIPADFFFESFSNSFYLFIF